MASMTGECARAAAANGAQMSAMLYDQIQWLT
jgi:hypothetical protein